MDLDRSRLSVVVGIDGSRSAIHAAEWAADEAVFRDIPLRLVHVIVPGSEAVRLETEYAETALLTAVAAAEATGLQVKIETAILRGRINAVLARESRSAALICVGARGLGHRARKRFGSTAAALTKSAHCPVAIIAGLNASGPQSGCVAVLLDESADGDVRLEMAISEITRLVDATPSRSANWNTP